MSEQARAAIGSETIEAVADRGYYSGEELWPASKPPSQFTCRTDTSAFGRKVGLAKQDFVYVVADDVYIVLPASS